MSDCSKHFHKRMQSEYKVDIVDSWISEIVEPATKAKVEKETRRFVADANMTGVPRMGKVRFYNDEYGIESILTVNQDNFEPRVDITADYVYLGVSGLGTTVNFDVDANIPFSVSTSADWITLPASDGVAGTYSIPVAFSRNDGAERAAEIVIRNDKYAYEKVLTCRQFASGILFSDDFSWLAPVIDVAKASDPGNYDTVGTGDLSAKAPNLCTTAALKAVFVPLRDAIGYVIPGKDDGANNVVYPQEYYLKMGKTSSSSQTSLTLPAIDPSGKDYELSVDWARMVQGSGTIDNYNLLFMISGNGTFENGTKYSEEFSTPQGKGEIFWTTVSATIKGADKDTRITIVASDLVDKETGKIDYTKSGARRMFIDNIVAKSK